MDLIKRLSLMLALFLFFSGCSPDYPPPPIGSYQPFDIPAGNISVVFAVASDAQYAGGDDPNYFRHACERIASGGRGQFIITPGDMVPEEEIQYTIRTYIGPEYLRYPVVGNHELDIWEGYSEPQDMIWLRNFNQNGNTLPNIVKLGPPGCLETTYSFEAGNAHFIILNEYFDGMSDTGTDGDIHDSLHDWLVDDLNRNQKPVVLVFGHEPAYPQPDEESGRIRHEDDSLNQYPGNRDRFWNILVVFGVKAYICGHTHNYSMVNIQGVWHIEDGHAQGLGDTGSRSTFLMFYVMDEGFIWIHVYRLNLDQNRYERTSVRSIN